MLPLLAELLLGGEAEVAGQVLGETARELERASAEGGAVRTSTLNFVATNGRILVATRSGEEPLYYTRLEGTDRCEVCGITPAMPETHPGMIAHRRHRAVVVASHLKRTQGWVELTQGTVLAVSERPQASQNRANWRFSFRQAGQTRGDWAMGPPG